MTTSFIVDVEEELTQKYGKGKTSLRKCETCDYEQVIQSAGVHVSESGAIKVYADDDKFSCPKCDGNDDNLDEVPESKGSLHLIVSNLFAFEVEAIYHEKHRILLLKLVEEKTYLL